jgi:hypothetical protein
MVNHAIIRPQTAHWSAAGFLSRSAIIQKEQSITKIIQIDCAPPAVELVPSHARTRRLTVTGISPMTEKPNPKNPNSKSSSSKGSNVVELYAKRRPRPASYDPLREVPMAALTGGPLPPVEEGLRLMNAYFAIGEPAIRTALMEHAERLADAYVQRRQARSP